MRKKGQRGYLPSKSVPVTRRFTKVNDNEDVDSGVARGAVDVNAVMAEHFNPYDHLEKVPHGIDPFATEETSIRKKVVFRPSKAQMGAITNKKKHAQVVEHSGEAGYAPVKHEKKFLAKNSDRVVPIWSVPTVEHVERVDTAGLQQFARPSVEHNPRQEEVVLNSINAFDYQPFFPDASNPIYEQHRKIQSIQEVVRSRIQVAQAATLGNGGANLREMSGKARSKSAKTTAGRIDEASQGNQWGDYGLGEQPAYDEPRTKASRQRPLTDQDLMAEPTDYDAQPTFDHAEKSKSQTRRRVQFSPEVEEAHARLSDGDVLPRDNPSGMKAQQRRPQAATTSEDAAYQLAGTYGDSKPDLKAQQRRAQGQPASERTSSQLDVNIPDQNYRSKPQPKRHQARVNNDETGSRLDAATSGNYPDPNLDLRAHNRRYQAEVVDDQTSPQVEVDTAGNFLDPNLNLKSHNRRYQAEVVDEQTSAQVEVDTAGNPIRPNFDLKSHNRRYQAEVVDEQTSAQVEVDTAGDLLDPNLDLKSHNRRYQARSTEKPQAQRVEISDPAQDEPPKEQHRRRQNHPTKKQAHAALDVKSIVPSRDAQAEQQHRRRAQEQAHEKQQDLAMVESEIAPPRASGLQRPARPQRVQKSRDSEQTQVALEPSARAQDSSVELKASNRRYQATDESQAKQQNRAVYETATPQAKLNPPAQHRQQQASDEQHQTASREVDVDVRALDRFVHARPQKIQAEPEGVYVAQRLTVADPSSRVKAALERVRRSQHNPAHEIAQPLELVSTGEVSRAAAASSNRRVHSAKPEAEDSQAQLPSSLTAPPTNQVYDASEILASQKHKKMQGDTLLQAGETFAVQAPTEQEVQPKQRAENLVNPNELEVHSGFVNPNEVTAGYDPQLLDLAETKNHVARESRVPTNIEIAVRPDQEGQKTGLETNTRSREPIIKADINSGANHAVTFRKTAL